MYGGRHGGLRHMDVKGKSKPVYKVKGGYRKTGKVYRTKAEARNKDVLYMLQEKRGKEKEGWLRNLNVTHVTRK